MARTALATDNGAGIWMNMIVRPAHGMDENPVVLADACDVCPQPGLEFL